MTTLLEIRAHQTAHEAVPPTPAVVTADGRACWYPADTILTLENVADILGVSEKLVRAMVRKRGLRASYATAHRPYVLYGWLVEFLRSKAA